MSLGFGTTAEIGIPMPGLVPNVIMGSSAEASSAMVLSYAAPSSVGSERQRASAASHAAPCGAYGRPQTYSYVASSGAINPPRAPASMDILQTVIRSSMENDRTAEPQYSKMQPVPPPMPMRAMSARMMSFAVTPAFNAPSARTW